jgi:hypothetical protein
MVVASFIIIIFILFHISVQEASLDKKKKGKKGKKMRQQGRGGKDR